MSQQIFSDPFVVLDTETTGVYNNAQLLEIAAVCIDEWGMVRSRFSSLIKPERPVDPKSKAMQVNQISIKELTHAPQWDTVRFHFDKWLRAIPTKEGEVISTAFNKSFDKRMLENRSFSLNWGMCIRTMSNKCMKATNKQPKDINGKNRAPSLKEACLFFEIPYPKDAHRALVDAEVTAKVAIKAFQQLQMIGTLL